MTSSLLNFFNDVKILDTVLKLSSRLVGEKLSDSVVALSIKKAVAQNKGVAITNVPTEKLSSKIILELYRLRWQIK